MRSVRYITARDTYRRPAEALHNAIALMRRFHTGSTTQTKRIPVVWPRAESTDTNCPYSRNDRTGPVTDFKVPVPLFAWRPLMSTCEALCT